MRPEEKAEVQALLAQLPPQDFRGFVRSVKPRFQWFPHAALLGDAFERIVAGQLKRLMVFMPPRLGKSETISRLGSAYFLRRHPDQFVGLCSYSAELAYVLSRNARGYYKDEALLAVDSQAVKHWETGHGGGLWAAGVGGSITGKGFHLGIIDDPIKNAEDAASQLIRQKQADWYDSTFVTRAEPNAAIILICTRWHEQDLAGWLLERERAEPEQWEVLNFPALYEPAYHRDWASTVTVTPDWRTQEDEPLCEARAPKARLEQLRRENAHVFAALFQQHPQPREGGMFQRQWFPIVSSAPLEGQTVRFWDCASTKDGGDFTAGVKMRRTPKGEYYVLDVVTGRWDSGARDKMILQTARADGFHVKQRREQEPGSAGKDAGLAFVRLLEGFSASFTPATGDKVERADPFASQCQAGQVKLVHGAWNQPFLDELTAFPTGAHDDQVDAASGAFSMLAKKQILAVSPGGLASDNWTRMGHD